MSSKTTPATPTILRMRAELIMAGAQAQEDVDASRREGEPAEIQYLLTGVLVGMGVAAEILKGFGHEQALDTVATAVETALDNLKTKEKKTP